MVSQVELNAYLNDYLAVDRYSDYCPNGLQVSGVADIKILVSGVTACQALLDAAVARHAHALIVHHGYFWKNENPCLTGMKRQRIATLLQHNMNLFAYHLPLDIHPIVGNNAQLAQRLGIRVTDQFEIRPKLPLGFVGELASPIKGDDFAHHIQSVLQRPPLHVAGTDRPIQRVAWCTGAAQNYLTAALAYKIDAYISGEVSESTVHAAREEGLHFFAAGHHATERYGIQALGRHLAKQFDLEHHFVDIDNPV